MARTPVTHKATLTVEFHSAEQAEAFREATTGNDNDVVLAAENAINKRLGFDHWVAGDAEPIWLSFDWDGNGSIKIKEVAHV